MQVKLSKQLLFPLSFSVNKITIGVAPDKRISLALSNTIYKPTIPTQSRVRLLVKLQMVGSSVAVLGVKTVNEQTLEALTRIVKGITDVNPSTRTHRTGK